MPHVPILSEADCQGLIRAVRQLGANRVATELSVSRSTLGGLMTGTARRGTVAVALPPLRRLLAELAAHAAPSPSNPPPRAA